MFDLQNVEMENIRELLKMVEARNSQLLTIMHQYTNYVTLILVGIWTIFTSVYLSKLSELPLENKTVSTSDLFSNLFLREILLDPIFGLMIALLISIAILIVWRSFIHQIDNNIAQNYRKIILFEKRLYGNPDQVPETSALHDLLSDLNRICPQIDNQLIKYDKKSYNQKSEFVFKLIDKGLIGYRGQQIFDIGSGLLIIIFSIAFDWVTYLKYDFQNGIFIIVGIASLIPIFVGWVFLFGINITGQKIIPIIQKDPDCNDIEGVLKNIVNDEPNQDNKLNELTFLKIVGIFFCIVIFFYIGYYFGYNNGYNDAQKVDGQNLNEFFHNQYYYQIKGEGKAIIDDNVAKTEKISNDSAKLNQIASLITQDFSNPFWADVIDLDGLVHWKKFFYGNASGSGYKPFINRTLVMPQFWYEKRGKVRLNYIANDSIFWDPEWVAYQKTGGCQELSVLFNATANRAGIETRIVRSDGAYETGHMWNEVNISGEWKFFDVQKYGEKKYTNESTFWFGNTSEYAEKNFNSSRCDITKFGVYVLNLEKDGYGDYIAESYDPKNLCYHGTRRI